jgi:alkylation response protein AidB-like acyl-CoA dehydrogenase
VRFAFTDEQDELRSVLRRFLQDRADGSARAALDGEHDPAIWRSMAGELGLQAMAVPEELGGQGWGVVELAIASEELGRVVHPGPFFASSVLATRVLVGSAATERLAPVLSGDRVVAFAGSDGGGGFDPAEVRTTFDPSAGVVTGTKRLVVSAAQADDLLLVARQDGLERLVLVSVDPSGTGVQVNRLEGLDPTRQQADVVLASAPAHVVAEDAAALVSRAVDEAGACLAAELAGVAQRCLELTVAYAGERVQFGVPIGSFQAVKHRCADILVDVEHSRSAAYVAACRATEPDDRELARATSTALAVCGDAAARAAK